jgi:GT2 family glycosyltransferase
MQINQSEVVVVTVTYGKRWNLLKQVIEAVQSEGGAKVIVIDNGSQEDITQLATTEFGDFVDVVKMGKNTGSAGGFCAGFKTALESKYEYILLLDDDNKLIVGSLNKLKTAYAKELTDSGVSQDSLALLGFREDHQADVAMGVSQSRINPRPGSFFGFHVLDVLFKIWRRLPIGKQKMQQAPLPEKVILNVAPWSGLYFHRSLIEKHGLPNEQLVLYADDTEYTWRITAAGGRIVLATAVQIEDIDKSWNIKSQFGNSFDSFLMGDGDFRVYYGVRNQAYFEKHCLPENGWTFINKGVYLTILKIRSIMLGKNNRWQLLKKAIANGHAINLGIAKEFPL